MQKSDWIFLWNIILNFCESALNKGELKCAFCGPLPPTQNNRFWGYYLYLFIAMFVPIFWLYNDACTQKNCLYHTHTKYSLIYYNTNPSATSSRRHLSASLRMSVLMHSPYLVVCDCLQSLPFLARPLLWFLTHTHTLFVLSFFACSPPFSFSDTFPYSYYLIVSVHELRTLFLVSLTTILIPWVCGNGLHP